MKTPNWVADAACLGTDPELFHPAPKYETTAYRLAKRICAPCPIRDACLEYALTRNDMHGVWGGTTPRERDALQRRRNRPRTQCKNGHQRTPETTALRPDGKRECRLCRRDYQAAHQARRRPA